MNATSALALPLPFAPVIRPKIGPKHVISTRPRTVNEAAFLTRIVWERSGRPRHLRQQYRREVESQLRATRHLLEEELRGARLDACAL